MLVIIMAYFDILWHLVMSNINFVFFLHVPGLEDVFFSPQDQTVTEGEAVFLQCVSGESLPPASISWLKDGEVVARGKQIQVSSNEQR